MKVFITRQIPDEAEVKLVRAGFEVSTFSSERPIQKGELIEYGREADAIISLLTDNIDREVIDSLEKCRVIANYAVGYNNIDVNYAKSKGITVTNTPDILTNATADIAMTLLLACARHIAEGEKVVRTGKFTGWKPRMLLGVELYGKTFGIVGAGRIGRETARRAKAFGMKIIYYSRSKKEDFEIETGAVRVKLEELAEKADVISLHVPLTAETGNLVNKDILDRVKEMAIIINTARGEVIDEEYLIEKLEKRKIYAAGFDVYKNEPEVDKRLLNLDNVVLLPHLGSATYEARGKMAELCAENIIAVLDGKSAVTPV